MQACTLSGPKGPLRVVVVGQTTGLVLWNFDTQQRIAKHGLPQSEFTERTVSSMRGIASSDSLVFVGTSTGRVVAFNADGAQEATLGVSEHAVTDLAHFFVPNGSASGEAEGHLAVATSDGAIAVWAGAPKMKREYTLQAARPSMAVSLAVVLAAASDEGGGGGGGPPLLVAGYTCGHLRVYSTARREILYEIAAHARPITSLSVSAPLPPQQQRGRLQQVVSSGEDSVLNVWTLAEDKATLSFSELLDNTLVVGACFMGADQGTLAATAFDYEGVFTWRLPLASAANVGGGGAKGAAAAKEAAAQEDDA
jgi:hypothetical protein